MIGQSDIEAAAARIAGHVRVTPVIRPAAWSDLTRADVTLKLEQLQHTGSFKARGAFNRILSAAAVPAGVIAASGGNHGLAVAYAARVLGHGAEIFVPEIAHPVKIEALKAQGATVHVTGRDYAEAYEASEVRRAETGALRVHAYDQPEVVAGQGTTGREFDTQVPDLDTVLVAVGGGGLIGGVAAWFGGRVKVIGVEPATSRALHAAREAGTPVDVPVSGIAADSLGARRIGSIAFEIAQMHVEHVVLVEDADIIAARRLLWRDLRVVAEPGGAAATAALLSGRYVAAPGERVGILVCGANCHPGDVL
jgi:threonine dehydratase